MIFGITCCTCSQSSMRTNCMSLCRAVITSGFEREKLVSPGLSRRAASDLQGLRSFHLDDSNLASNRFARTFLSSRPFRNFRKADAFTLEEAVPLEVQP